MKKDKIVLLGSGGHAVSCIDVIESTKKYKIIGLIDNSKKNFLKVGNKAYKIYNEKYFIKNKKFLANKALIAIGSQKYLNRREKLFNKYKNKGIKFPTILSPFSYVSKSASIGEGTIIMHGVVVNANARVGSNCIINSQSLIEHDCKVGNHSHIATSATINGHVNIGKNCFVGSKSVIIPSIKIKNKIFIKSFRLIKTNHD